jgi:hypothetical protein
MPWWGQTLMALGLGCIPMLWTSLRGWARFARHPQAFRCRIGDVPGGTGIGTRWRRRRTWARWVNDVLLIRSGLLRMGIQAVAAELAPGTVLEYAPLDVRLGLHPISLRMTTDDGDVIDVAVALASRTLLAGPFLAAAIPGLPRAPREHGT